MPKTNSAPLGIIEGYYGKPWSWQERAGTIAFLQPQGYGFYIYAPKFDTHLRERWTEDHRREEMDELVRFAAHCRSLDVRFGVGLSPMNIFRNFDAEEQVRLATKPGSTIWRCCSTICAPIFPILPRGRLRFLILSRSIRKLRD